MSQIPPNTPASLEAGHNLCLLKENTYSGRGLAVGIDETGKYMIQMCWISGRSVGSRNRVYSADGSRLYTEVADPALATGDQSLTLYNAMNEDPGMRTYVVSNGRQTEETLSTVRRGGILTHGLRDFSYEPDSPIWTPRITAACNVYGDAPVFELAMLRKSDYDEVCQRFYWYYPSIPAGYGYCITTYSADGSPPPYFKGEPRLVPMKGTPEEMKKLYWDDVLAGPNIVALAMKKTPIERGRSELFVWNKNKKVEGAV